MISPEVWIISQRPYKMAKSFSTYSVNGCNFHTYSYGAGRATQCFGVSVIAKTSSYSSVNDRNPTLGEVTYYGRIIDIVELNYVNEGDVVLFKCEWVTNTGVRDLEPFGIRQVNFNHVEKTEDINSEPFILASQAKQVYYLEDPVEKDWHAVVCPTIRDYYDMQPAIDDYDC